MTKKYHESFNEELQYLKDLLPEDLDLATPFVITDPKGEVEIAEYIPHPFVEFDLSTMKAYNLEQFLKEIENTDKPFILLRNIGSISTLKDRQNWENMISSGLKSESKTFIFKCSECVDGLKEYRLPFDKVKLICTCTEYPDYLKNKGNLGKGPDFTDLY